MQPDGVFLSNGLGEFEPCVYAIEDPPVSRQEYPNICPSIDGSPVGRRQKMIHGHHGANHPVQDLRREKLSLVRTMGSQAQSRSEHLKCTHKSLFDGTVQGIRHTQRPAFGFRAP